jgi:MFS family permease
VLSYGLFGFGYVTTATFLVAIVRSWQGGASLESLVWMAVGLAGMPSVLIWNRLGARFGVLRMYAAACLVEAIGVAASVAPLGVVGLVLSAILLGGTFMAITALGLVAARAFTPAAPARALGLMTAAFGVGQIIGPLVAGAAVDRTGSYVLPSLLSAALLVLGAVISGKLQPRLEQKLAAGIAEKTP